MYRYLKYFLKISYQLISRKVKKNIAISNSYSIFSDDKHHIFFGYYDIQQISFDGQKMLVHKILKKADTKKDSAELGYYDLRNNEYHFLCTTNAWCWQQGARLRWHPLEQNIVLFNDREKEDYCTRIFNVETNKILETIPFPLYDVDSSFIYGATCNFSRLQRIRPGYGYDSLPDKTENANAPIDDGIFLVNLKSYSRNLICSLQNLALEVDSSLSCEHYINHISFSPDGKHLMFFHIWLKPEFPNWKTRLFVYDIENSVLKCLESNFRVSHYAWKSNSELLITCYGKRCFYRLYELNGTSKDIGEQILVKDGHPTFVNNNIFISDTYPNRASRQELFYYNIENNKKTILADISAYPFARGEKRCDLHPRFHKETRIITIDTLCKEDLRNVVLLPFQNEVI